MAQFQVLYWHDIPVQVRARDGRQRASQPLSNRFQDAIDRAAMAAGLVGSDEYTDLFQWSEPEERDGTVEKIVAAVAAELEARYLRIDWQKTAVSLRTKL